MGVTGIRELPGELARGLERLRAWDPRVTFCAVTLRTWQVSPAAD